MVLNNEPTEPSSLTVSFRAGELSPAIRERGDNPHLVARRDLARYYAMLQRGADTAPYTVAEAKALVEGIHNWRVDPASLHLLWAHIADVARRSSGYRQRHSAETITNLIDRLRVACCDVIAAAVDASERYWQLPDTTPDEDRLRAVGFQLT